MISILLVLAQDLKCVLCLGFDSLTKKFLFFNVIIIGDVAISDDVLLVLQCFFGVKEM